MSSTVINNGNHYINEYENLHEESETTKNNDNYLTKNILLYKNGDMYFPAKRFVVNKKHIRNWEIFLEELTKNLNPRNGAIRDIRTPLHGTRIRSLDDLTANGKYVAISNGETLKIMNYEKAINTSSPPQPSKYNSIKLKPLKPVNYDMDKIESRIQHQLNIKSSIIYVFRNGDPFTRAIKIVIKPQEQKHMSILVKAIEERVLLPTNKPIRRLYTLNGDLIRFAKDIEDSQYYVAASHEPFENIKYGQFLPVIRAGRVSSKRNQVKYLNNSFSMKEQESTHRNTSDEPTDRSQKHTEHANSKAKSISNRQNKNETQKSEKELAAIQIQAAFRGYYIRKEIEKAKENNEPLPQRKYNPLPKIKKTDKTSQEKQPSNEKSTQHEDIERPSKLEKRRNDENSKHRKFPEKRNSINNNSENKNKEKAVIKIQAGFRGYLTRKNFRKNTELVTNEDSFKNLQNIRKTETEKNETGDNETEKAAVIIQAGFRGFITRQNLKHNKQKTYDEITHEQYEEKSDKENLMEESNDDELKFEKAAVTIQAGFRGFKTRQNLKHDKRHTHDEIKNEQCEEKSDKENLMEESNDDEIKFEKAAVTIQAGFRSFKTRKQFRERERAAERIQAGFRGYRVRKDKKVKEHAAIRIQAGFRGFKTRKEIKRKAIEKIQAGYRGYQFRKDLENNVFTEEQEKIRNDAAVKIQAAFRGHVYRRDQI